MAIKFDPDKPYSPVYGSATVAYVQDGVQFDHESNEIVPDKSLEAQQLVARIDAQITRKDIACKQFANTVLQRQNQLETSQQAVEQAQTALKEAQGQQAELDLELKALTTQRDDKQAIADKLDKPGKLDKPAPAKKRAKAGSKHDIPPPPD